MKKIAFHIQKGGQGKSSLSGNVAFAAAKKTKTILVDCDPQGNSSSWFLTNNVKWELADVLKENVSMKDAIVQISDNFYLLPTFGIDGGLKEYAETQLLNKIYVFNDLTNAIEKLGFNIAIFDLSPGMSLLEKRILMSMDEVITPLTPEYFSLDGIEIFSNELKKIKKDYRSQVKHEKIVVNNINQSFKRHKLYYEAFLKLNYQIFTVVQDSKIAECQIKHKSIFEYCPDSRAIPEIEKLTLAVMEA
jgi:chromosome partitioning protein